MPLEPKPSVPLLSPDPERRRRLIELLNAFLEDKVSLAELKGISREKLFLLADAGYVKFKHGRVDEAERIYQALIVLDHRNAHYHSVMGAIHQKKERPVEAILEYTRAIQIDKGDISSHVNRGEIYLRHRNFRKAAEDFRQAIVMDSSGRNLWANRSRSLVIALKRSLEAQKRAGAPAQRHAPSKPLTSSGSFAKKRGA
jgi:tetratricopeptide (TPR) repeat protein